MVSNVYSATVIGINAYKITVEIDINNSLPSIVIVGLPDAAVSEAKERVRSAIKNSGFEFPLKKIVINLAPADLKKEGTNYDLPIAVGILAQSDPLLQEKIKDFALVGELSLDGSIKPINGVLSIVSGLKNLGINRIIIPEANKKEAALIDNIDIYPAKTLNEVIEFLKDFNKNKQEVKIIPYKININDYLNQENIEQNNYDFKYVKGQQKAKKALEIAAAGEHNLLMIGAPGSGKTLLAKCFSSILPPLTLKEAIELTQIYSISGLLKENIPLIYQRPFRFIHHTASSIGIIGGGSNPKPGEITLAHRGVLFLDEMVEFPRNVLESLRQPLEDGEISISRAQISVKYPARFILLGAMNPCPCGFYGDKEKYCTCSDHQIKKYRSKLSGPLLDRIDIQVEVPRLSSQELLNNDPLICESSHDIKQRVILAKNIQLQRYKNYNITSNSQLSASLVKKFCNIEDKNAKDLLRMAIDKFKLSARTFERLLKLSRTIADLNNSDLIKDHHIAQALQYKNLITQLDN